MAICTSCIFLFFFFSEVSLASCFSLCEYNQPSVRQYTYQFYVLFIQCVYYIHVSNESCDHRRSCPSQAIHKWSLLWQQSVLLVRKELKF